MLVDSLLPHIAGELGLRVVAPLRGGEFGATLVRDRDGNELVLKASSKAWAPRFARGAALAARLRARGYPAPVYLSTGTTGNASWSVQEQLPGETPAVMTEPHARRLTELARQHANAAGAPSCWLREAAEDARTWATQLAAREVTAALASELAGVVRACADAELRDQDIVHNDFSHRNYLAVGDDVTGVVDWEQAVVGDWRLDLVTLSYWAALQPARVPPDVAALVAATMHDACPPRLLALFAAYLALRHLDYEAHAHPPRLRSMAEAIETRVAPWWRDASRPRVALRRAG